MTSPPIAASNTATARSNKRHAPSSSLSSVIVDHTVAAIQYSPEHYSERRAGGHSYCRFYAGGSAR